MCFVRASFVAPFGSKDNTSCVDMCPPTFHFLFNAKVNERRPVSHFNLVRIFLTYYNFCSNLPVVLVVQGKPHASERYLGTVQVI